MRSLPRRDAAGYLPIEAYAAVGGGATLALVGTDGAIDWLCVPRFDSSPALARLLDAPRGGFFVVSLEDASHVERAYRPGTNVLDTTFRGPAGRLRMTDFMPLGRAEVVRRVEALNGEVEVVARFREGPELGAAAARGAAETLSCDAPIGRLHVQAPAAWRRDPDGTWTSRRRLSAGDHATFALVHASAADAAVPAVDADRLLSATLDAWADWSRRVRYQGRYRDAVVRSALALSLLVHPPTGALVAAGTTSLPEEPGGVRNWDYRFTWLRDSALVLDALMQLGLHDEAMRFWGWLERLCLGCCDELQIMYTLDGDPVPAERIRDDLEGWRGSAPVRIGNAAGRQRQLDVYGYVLDAAYVCQTRMREPHPRLRPVLGHLADRAAALWREPDQGIWEIRGPARHFLHSKLMCWVALDRAVRLVERGWLEGDVDRWRDERDAVRERILREGYSEERGAFAQVLGGRDLDAAGLLVPLVGLLPATDPRVGSTLQAVRATLEHGGCVYRYLTEDGLPGGEGAFVICSFWLVEALAGAGRRDEAAELFERLLRRSNDVGLFSEQLEPGTGAFLGNHPQAFSHLSLIRAALAVEGQANDA